MKTHKIYYHEYSGDGPDAVMNSPFAVEGIGFGLESEGRTAPRDAIYSPCPAWKHRTNRLFTVRSPVDIDCIVDRPNEFINSAGLTQEQFDDYFSATFAGNWCSPEKTTIQLTVPRFIFWTESENIWIEQRPHPLTSLNNNLVCVGGWFNISNWNRPTSFAFDIVNTDLPVIIKRGDPLCQMSFYSPNLDDGYIVQRAEPPEEVVRLATRTSDVVNTFARNIPQDIINKLFKKKESKCPFHHLWKR